MLLEYNARLIVRLRWILEDGSYANTVNVRPFGPSEAFSRLPCTLNTLRISVRRPETVSAPLSNHGERPVG